MSNSKTVAKPVEHILKKMHAHPWLPEPLLHLAVEVIRLQEEARTLISPLPAHLTVEKSLLTPQEAHYQGQALLAAERFPYDAEKAAELWEALLQLAQSQDGPMQSAARAVQGAHASATPLSAVDAFDAYVRDDADFFAHWAQRMPEAPAMTRFLAQAALSPWLHAVTQSLHGFATDKVWEFGTCPHCGHLPYMGQLRGKEGARWHVCSFCHLSYRAARLQCPVCLEKDTEKLHFFVAAEAPEYEVHVCESCKNYLKLSDAREKDSAQLATALPALAALEDLDSLPLDLAARQQGYVRNTLSAWGF